MKRTLPTQAPNGPATITDTCGNMWHNHSNGYGALFAAQGISLTLTPVEIENLFGVASHSYPKAV